MTALSQSSVLNPHLKRALQEYSKIHRIQRQPVTKMEVSKYQKQFCDIVTGMPLYACVKLGGLAAGPGTIIISE